MLLNQSLITLTERLDVDASSGQEECGRRSILKLENKKPGEAVLNKQVSPFGDNFRKVEELMKRVIAI